MSARGRGRGSAPPRMREDRDVLGYANKRVANLGPPQIATFPKRSIRGIASASGVPIGGRGFPPRGASGRGGPSTHIPRGSGRGGGIGPSAGGDTYNGDRSGDEYNRRTDVYRPRYSPSSSPQPQSGPGPSTSRFYDAERENEGRSWNGPSLYTPSQPRYHNYNSNQHSNPIPSSSLYQRQSSPDRYSSHTNACSNVNENMNPYARERRYSPSQPTLEHTWSPKINQHPLPANSLPSASSSKINGYRPEPGPTKPHDSSTDRFPPIVLPHQGLSTQPAHNNPTSINDTRNLNGEQHINQHLVFESSPSLPPPTPTESNIDPAFNRPPPSGPSSSRRSSPPKPSCPTWTTDGQEQASAPSSTHPNGTNLIKLSNSTNITQPPEIKKMTFKPNNPNTKTIPVSLKDKGKGKEMEVKVKFEPGIHHSAAGRHHTQDDMMNEKNHDADMDVDVKPNIEELEEEIEYIDDGIKRSGTLAFIKTDIPQCWNKDLSQRKDARLSFRETKKKELSNLGRKMTGTHWRDDGVAFDWTLLNTRKESHTQPAENVPIVDATRLLAPVGEESIPQSSSISKPKQTSSPSQDVKSSIKIAASSDSPKIDSIPTTQSKSKHTAHGTTIPSSHTHAPQHHDSGVPFSEDQLFTSTSRSTDDVIRYIVEYPAEFATAKLRYTNKDSFQSWLKEKEEKAANPDSKGKPTRKVDLIWKTRLNDLEIVTTPLPSSNQHTVERSDDPSSWPDNYFEHKDYLMYPDNLATSEQRLSEPKEFAKWTKKVERIMSDPDEKGRPTRWVKSLAKKKTLTIFSQLKTEEEIKSYDGKPIKIDSACAEKLCNPGPTTDSAPPLQYGKSPVPYQAVESTAKPKPAGTPVKSFLSKDLDIGTSITKEKKKKRGTTVDSQTKTEIEDETSPTKSDKPSKKKKKSNHSETAPPASLNPFQTSQGNPVPKSTPSNSIQNGESSQSNSVKPNPTSPKLETLNFSLRQKVSEIEKWTQLSSEFPDLTIALSVQITKTREEIFELYDDIAAEKKKLGI
ncbi:uncharacterized protein IL334_001134 [Kwoniella shivajii]|uniref:Myb-like domain-containing protein n=1 Tax=Kwoniella shivajii TaxID=564305 RepID=A0ABZ1CSN5_9TREE|nr:hypothetical protein IL334_001134 [Kwoniella shivajii]